MHRRVVAQTSRRAPATHRKVAILASSKTPATHCKVAILASSKTPATHRKVAILGSSKTPATHRKVAILASSRHVALLPMTLSVMRWLCCMVSQGPYDMHNRQPTVPTTPRSRLRLSVK